MDSKFFNVSTHEARTLLLDVRPERPDKSTFIYEHECQPRDEHIVLTFGPGIVRYLKGSVLRQDNYSKLIEEIESFGNHPELRFPPELALFDEKGPGDSWGNYRMARIRLHYFEIVANESNYKKKIGLITYIVENYIKSPFSESDYWIFSTYLQLKKLAIDEFKESLVEVPYKDKYSHVELINSYLQSEEYEVINDTVFRKTLFWKRVLKQNQEIADAEMAHEIQKSLEISNYSTYVYIMEDARNGFFKIGKSNNPHKRERTLQSEAPTTQLRLAIPCNDATEFDLHQRYDSHRRRGEWFELDSSMLFDLVIDLLNRGDVARLFGEREWLGEVLVRKFAK